MNSFIVQQVYERRWLVGVTSLALMLLSVFVVSLYPVLSQLHSSSPVIENMPVLFEGFLGELLYLREFPTFLASQLFTIHLPLWLGITAVLYGWSVSGAAENRGEFRTALARPMSRVTLALSNWVAMMVMVTICIAMITLGVYLALPFIEGEMEIALPAYGRLVLLIWLYASAVAAMTYAMGSVVARRWGVVLLGMVVVVAGYYVAIFSAYDTVVSGLSWMSLMAQVNAVGAVQTGMSLLQIASLCAVIGVALIVAVVALVVRDVTR